LLARRLVETQRGVEAREAFERAIDRFGTFEAYAENQIWALSSGDATTAARLQAQIDRIMSRWNAMNRELNDRPLRCLKAAQQLAQDLTNQALN
jgi:hypothetical protein